MVNVSWNRCPTPAPMEAHRFARRHLHSTCSTTSGTPDPGGTWTDPISERCSAVCSIRRRMQPEFTTTCQGQAVCPDSSATATVTVF